MGPLENLRKIRPHQETQALKEKLLGLYDNVARFYKVWAVLDPDAIDFRLTPLSLDLRSVASIKPTLDLEGKRRVIAVLEGCSRELSNIIPPLEERDNYASLLAKLNASRVYMLRSIGETMDPFAYIQETMGIKPKEIPEETLLTQKQKVVDLFREAGGNGYDKQSLQAFYTERLISPEEMVKKIEAYGERALDLVGRFIGEEIKVKYKASFVKEDAYWFNWADGTIEEGFTLRVNNHPRHWEKFTDGRAQAMAFHEIAAHFGMMQKRAELIKRGDLREVFGLTTVHDPEQVLLEGIAQTLHYFVPDLDRTLTPEGRLAIELYGLRQMVYNNVHLKVNSPDFTNSPEEINDIINYVRGFHPAESEENIYKEIKDRREDPKLQAYLYSYGIGFRLLREIAQELNHNGKREFLKRVFPKPFTPTQLGDLHSTLRSNPRYRGS